MYDDYCSPDLDELPEADWARLAYQSGLGAAEQGQTLPEALRLVEESGAPFGDDERRAMIDGYCDGLRYARDMAAGNDKPRAA